MGTKTLLQLRTNARERANMENSTFVSNTEFNQYINYSISELRDILTSKVGEDYFATSSSISLLSSTDTYNLPADFYKCLWVELLGDDGYYYKIRRFEISEQNYGSPLILPFSDIRYRIRANTLIFAPVGGIGGRTARLWYQPLFTELSADGDTLVGYNGWEEYVVLKSARKALVKEEQDVSQIDAELNALLMRIEQMAPNRDQGQPMRIYDNERTSYYGDGLWL